MSRRAQDNLITVVLLALFAGIIWLAQDFGPRARMIPLPLAIFGIVLTLIQMVWQNLGSTDELQMEMISVQAPGAQDSPEGDAGAAPEKKKKRVTWRQEAGAFGIVAALLGLIFLVGIIPAVFLFTGGYFLLSGLYSWRVSLIYTGILTATMYLLFMVALQIQPYHGLLEPLVDRFR
jgi:hypothetical protein